MKRTMLIGAAVTGIALSLATPAYAAGDAAKGKVKSITCMGCHGIPGYHNAYPNYPVPRVGGQHPRVHSRRAQGVPIRTARPQDDAGSGGVAQRAGHAGHRGVLRIGGRRMNTRQFRDSLIPHVSRRSR